MADSIGSAITPERIEELRDRLQAQGRLFRNDCEELFVEIAALLRHNQYLADELHRVRHAQASAAAPEATAAGDPATELAALKAKVERLSERLGDVEETLVERGLMAEFRP